MQDQCLSSDTHHLAPVNVADLHTTTDLVIHWLSSREKQELFSAKHAAFMILQVADALRTNFAFGLCAPVTEAGLQFFWRVCLHLERREEIWHKDGPYAIQPIIVFMYVKSPANSVEVANQCSAGNLGNSLQQLQG